MLIQTGPNIARGLVSLELRTSRLVLKAGTTLAESFRNRRKGSMSRSLSGHRNSRLTTNSLAMSFQMRDRRCDGRRFPST